MRFMAEILRMLRGSRQSRSLSEIALVGRLGLARHLRRLQNGPIALLTSRLAALDVSHDPFGVLGRLSPPDS